MSQSKFNITGDDPEVAEKWKDLLKTAKEKGVLEICEPCTRKEIIEAALVDCFTFLVLAIISVAMIKYFGLWGFAGLSLFFNTHDVSYDQTNIFHRLVKTWRKP